MEKYKRPDTIGELYEAIKVGIDCEVEIEHAKTIEHSLSTFCRLKKEGINFNISPSKNEKYMIFSLKTEH